MGSSTSKSIDPGTAVTTVARRSCSRNVFQISCIRPASGSLDNSDNDIDDVDIDDEQVSDTRPKENSIEGNHSNTITSKSKCKPNKKVKTKRPDKRACKPSETQLKEQGESSLSGPVSRNSNPSNPFLSRFYFFPGNTSSRSLRAYPESSTSSVISNDDDLNSTRFGHKTKTRHGCEFFPSCFMPVEQQDENSDSDSGSDKSDVSSIHELGRNGNNNNGMESNPRNGNRRMEAREPVEQNVRFSRTLSVGRLRDRVLHRPTFPELASLQMQSEREVVSAEIGPRLSDENVMMSATSNYSSSISLYGNHDFEAENVSGRETSYTNLRANFLERRRRIRSQVHSLQRMGSRFENLSGHERSCILSGQHRTGQCTCRLNNQDPNDSTNASGSISRIVLLAEALFEVLDEIHQHSVVSSTWPALSSIGSVPAPIEVVERLPVKHYHKLPKNLNEEDAQCYICLVEYEEGDEVRVLPCHHEFHRLCIDKWLKEIHRICPLCRGDVCKTGSLPTEIWQL